MLMLDARRPRLPPILRAGPALLALRGGPLIFFAEQAFRQPVSWPTWALCDECDLD